MENSIYPILKTYNSKNLLVYQCGNCKHNFLSKKTSCDYCDNSNNNQIFENTDNIIIYDYLKWENQPLVFF